MASRSTRTHLVITFEILAGQISSEKFAERGSIPVGMLTNDKSFAAETLAGRGRKAIAR
jgi:hypothetical protein